MNAPVSQRRLLLRAAACAAAVPFATPLRAQQNVRIVVPFAAGSSTDVLARLLGECIRDVNGQNWIVENKPGAGGIIGSTDVTKAKPDGNVLMVTTGGHSTNAVLYDKLPYDPLRGFTPLSQLTVTPGFLLLVPNSSPYKTLDQLLAAAKASPGKLSYGSAGNGNTTHLCGALFERAAGIKLIHVPYKGTPMNDLTAGHIDMLFWGSSFATPIVKGGRAGTLAVSGERRLVELPDVPTLHERGLRGVDVPAWSGMFAPPGMKPELAAQIHRDVALAMQKPAFIAAYGSPDILRPASTPVQFADLLAREIARLKRDVTPLGIRMD